MLFLLVHSWCPQSSRFKQALRGEGHSVDVYPSPLFCRSVDAGIVADRYEGQSVPYLVANSLIR